jgi:ribonuclease D
MSHKEIRLYGEHVVNTVLEVIEREPETFPPRIKRLIEISSYKKVIQGIRNDCIEIAEKLDIPLEILASKKQINQYLKWCWFEVEECKIQGLEPDLISGWRKPLLADALKTSFDINPVIKNATVCCVQFIKVQKKQRPTCTWKSAMTFPMCPNH